MKPPRLMLWSNAYSVHRNLFKLAALGRSHLTWDLKRREDESRSQRMNISLTLHSARKFFVSLQRYRNAFGQISSMLVRTT